MIDVDRLRVLVALADHGSVTAAADALHYGQPTVTHHLHRLHVETGAVLVQRVGRGVRLTAEGERLVARGREILALLDRTDRELAALTAARAGVVRLAGFPSAVATLVPPAVARLAAAAPGLTLEIVEAEPADAADLLVRGDVDVALLFAYAEAPLPPNLTTAPLGSDDLHLITPAVGVAGPSTAAPAGLATSELAAYADRSWLAGCPRCRSHLVSVCEEAGFSPRIIYASDDYVAAQALVAAGHGVTMLPGLALRAHRNPGVDAVPVRSGRREIHVATYGQNPPTPAVTLLHRAIAASMDED